MRVPFNELRESSPNVRAAISAEIAEVVDSGIFINGPKTERFITDFSTYVGQPHVLPVGNGTDALEIGLRALAVGPEDEVVTVANAGGYASSAIFQVGAKPRYVDVANENLLMSPSLLEDLLAAQDPLPKAVIVTHLFGAMAPIEEIVKICDRFAVPVIEDCAQAMGLRRRKRHAGTFGVLSTFSFYPTKNLGALGDAGAVATADPELARRASALAQYGWDQKYFVSQRHGRNSRMDELQAAVLRLRLAGLEEENFRRLAIFNELARSAPEVEFVHRVEQEFNAHLAVIRTPNRQVVANHLRDRGIETAIHYPVPDHQQSAHAPATFSLPITESNAVKILSVPCHPRISPDQLACLKEALAGAPI